MAKLAATLWMDVQWCRPNPEDGKAGVFLRDVEMVRQADVVLAYFSTTEMSGGTAHVVEKAIDQEVPVYAYGFNGSAFERIGEHDVADAWAEAIQAELG